MKGMGQLRNRYSLILIISIISCHLPISFPYTAFRFTEP